MASSERRLAIGDGIGVEAAIGRSRREPNRFAEGQALETPMNRALRELANLNGEHVWRIERRIENPGGVEPA